VAKRVAVADPARIEIPAIDVDARLVPLGLERNGAMEVPAFGKAGWYTEGPKPGAVGPSVIAAHVDSKTGPDVFAKLDELKRGDEVTVTDKRGEAHTFVVERSKQTAKTALPAKEIWGKTNGPALRLITCGGAFDKRSGHYTANVTIFAKGAA
jgi:LPXTG-site transpeptidase (sortase) family protein